ncbi:SDR family oxidoreductase [Microbacterium esteraromaticum]|uniref:SDR family NAD(P)-dependent oxidoreductase n=1 Tax=Microbacterium esteraromaticum TaxID=57043 RepID=UPI001CD4960A|nr:SDR family oxidoreductase [Microbacterium esteraromaticum]MCA1307845.1 SDR family oxidoreductase [Microbacterium esteraromaticum]
MEGRVEGKVVALTGGGSGVGAASARALAAEGARVAILDYDADAAQAVASAIRAAGGEAMALEVDVRSRGDVRRALSATTERYGRLDVMANIAGISFRRDFLETTEDDFRRLYEVNVVGVMIGMQEAARIFIAQGGGGKIITACSTASRQANAPFSAYAASKFAAHSLVQSGARALAEHGIVVTGFAPGIVDTPLWRANFDDDAAREAALDEYGRRIPAGRVSTPEDIAPMVVFLASSGADYSTGQVFPVDGGLVMV